MRLMRMLGLAMVTAAAAAAFIGAGSASAAHLVVVCLEDPTGLCPAGKLKDAGPGLPILGILDAGPAIFLGAIKQECFYSDIKGLITKSSPLHGEITEIEFGDCTPCSKVTMSNLPYLVKFHHDLTGAHLWLMLIEQNPNPILVTMENCTFGITCIFTVEKLHLDVSNTASGLPLVLSLENVLTREGGSFLCGATGKFDANYLVEILHGDIKEKGWLALDENETKQ
jgi:hypothetical protein